MNDRAGTDAGLSGNELSGNALSGDELSGNELSGQRLSDKSLLSAKGRLMATALTLAMVSISGTASATEDTGKRSWLAGDHHVHSRYSVGWNDKAEPPTPVLGGDAIYPIPMNAMMGRRFGLSWIVGTDHGGPNHSKVNHDMAYPELLVSRQELPDIIQFFGMELNSPAADHSSLIIPFSDNEAGMLRDLEQRFDKREVYPVDKSRDEESRMIAALKYMDGLAMKPVVIANHPSRSLSGPEVEPQTSPRELRNWNDAAKDVAVGMAGAPGHQAIALNTERFPNGAPRGAYSGKPTMGGFDRLTAEVGGFWDAMLGEGRQWWITANSDSHIHWTEGGVDFWPGEYSKTYVYARKNHKDILDGIRHGRIFVTTGDLVSNVEFEVTAKGSRQSASVGDTLVSKSGKVSVTINITDPDGENHHGDNPAVRRIDVIGGEITGIMDGAPSYSNGSTRVLRRFDDTSWKRKGEVISITFELDNLSDNYYLRLRGTSTNELEPAADEPKENPWGDLWFYTNPIFVSVAQAR